MDQITKLLHDHYQSRRAFEFFSETGEVVNELSAAARVKLGSDVFAISDTLSSLRRTENNEPYSLLSLIHFLQAGTQHALYVRSATQANIPTVFIADRVKIRDLFSNPLPPNLPIIAVTPDEVVRNLLEGDLVESTNSYTHQQLHPISPVAPSATLGGAGAATDGTSQLELNLDEAKFFEAISAKEFYPKSKNGPILCPNRSFSELRKRGLEYFSALKKADEVVSTGGTKPTTSAATNPAKKAATIKRSMSSSSSAALIQKGGMPIILVPAAATSLLTLYNVKSFLELESFIDNQTVMNAQEDVQKPSHVLVTHHLPDQRMQMFEVLDSPQRLKPADWDRVVAVFVTGKAWQFRNWKWDNPVELLHHVKGFYAKYSDEKMDGTAQSWNITVLEVSRTQRHNDRAIVLGFWEQLMAYMASNKPHLIKFVRSDD